MKYKLKKLSKLDNQKTLFLTKFYSNIFGIFGQRDSYNETKKANSEKQKYIKSCYDSGHYPCIPYGSGVINQLYHIRKQFPLKMNFLDVGCGYGHIVALASALGFNAHGIEIQKKDKFEFTIYNYYKNNEYDTDAFNFKNYQDYDVIYFYQPMCDSEKCSKMYEHIIKEAKKGTIFIINGNSRPFEKCIKYDYCIYQKK